VRAAGLTTTELDSVLTGKYVEVYREPRVTIEVAKMAGNFVHVLGEVRLPGSYEVMPNATVLQAIARAGGATQDASLGSVILMRRTGPSSMVARQVHTNRASAVARRARIRTFVVSTSCTSRRPRSRASTGSSTSSSAASRRQPLATFTDGKRSTSNAFSL
jgi:protein involved in polysaccharide export with SLBB domain